MERHATKLLISEPPLQVLPSLAVAIGLNESLVIQQVHYWLLRSAPDEHGVAWVHNTMAQWHAQFPFWSAKTLRRTFEKARSAGWLIARKRNQSRQNQTLSYTINYEKLAHIDKSSGQNDHMHVPKMTTSNGQSDHFYTRARLGSETTSEIPPYPPASGGGDDLGDQGNENTEIIRAIKDGVRQELRRRSYRGHKGHAIAHYPAGPYCKDCQVAL